MKMKTYIVASLAEAVDQIKRDLGPDAVILSTRKYDSGKLFDRKRQKLEVVASVDVEEPKDSKGSLPVPGHSLRMFADIANGHMSTIRDELQRLREFVEVQRQNEVHRANAAASQAAPPSDTLRVLANAPIISSVASTALGDAVLAISQALMWHRLVPEAMQQLTDALLRVETTDPTQIKEAAAAWIMQRLPKPVAYNAETDPRIIAFVGQTGSGKTTTLVKLASRLALQQRKTVGFITLDHFRVGADEQLHKYASILDVPCHLATNKQEFHEALKALSSCDIVCVDTAGRSPFDTNGVKQLEEMLTIDQPIWRALVLPSAVSDPDLSQALQRFAALQYQHLIITKLDESVALGSLFNATYLTGKPLAYFTMGQHVPEDFEDAALERVIDCLLNFSGRYAVPVAAIPNEEAGRQVS